MGFRRDSGYRVVGLGEFRVYFGLSRFRVQVNHCDHAGKIAQPYGSRKPLVRMAIAPELCRRRQHLDAEGSIGNFVPFLPEDYSLLRCKPDQDMLLTIGPWNTGRLSISLLYVEGLPKLPQHTTC